MDTEYLQEVLGTTLICALTEVCLQRPRDPIEFIANHLRQDKKSTSTTHNKLEV